MKIAKKALLILVLLLSAASLPAQTRRNRIEVYGGAAFPLSPDTFKDYTNVGLGGNAQYVLFPYSRLGIAIMVGYEGFSTNNEEFADWLSIELTGKDLAFWVSTGVFDNPTADLESHLIRFGAGVRPYLTAPQASAQFFLLGQANYNFIINDFVLVEFPYQPPNLGFVLPLTFNDQQYEENIGNNDESVFGASVGGGVEIPVGSSLDIILQGVFNVLFTSDKNTTIAGVTAGVVF